MPIDSEELTRRLAEADRARLALRRATLELAALGARILADREGRQGEPTSGPERPDRRPAGRR